MSRGIGGLNIDQKTKWTYTSRAIGGVNAIGVVAIGGFNTVGVVAIGGFNAMSVVGIGGVSGRSALPLMWGAY